MWSLQEVSRKHQIGIQGEARAEGMCVRVTDICTMLKYKKVGEGERVCVDQKKRARAMSRGPRAYESVKEPVKGYC